MFGIPQKPNHWTHATAHMCHEIVSHVCDRSTGPRTAKHWILLLFSTRRVVCNLFRKSNFVKNAAHDAQCFYMHWYDGTKYFPRRKKSEMKAQSRSRRSPPSAPILNDQDPVLFCYKQCANMVCAWVKGSAKQMYPAVFFFLFLYAGGVDPERQSSSLLFLPLSFLSLHSLWIFSLFRVPEIDDANVRPRSVYAIEPREIFCCFVVSRQRKGSD